MSEHFQGASRGRKASPGPGFSLTETALALGIMSFALIGILVLLSVGLDTERAAMQQTRATQLAAQVIRTIRATPFRNVSLVSLDPTLIRTYDLTTSSTTVTLSADYEGNIIFQDAQGSPGWAYVERIDGAGRPVLAPSVSGKHFRIEVSFSPILADSEPAAPEGSSSEVRLEITPKDSSPAPLRYYFLVSRGETGAAGP